MSDARAGVTITGGGTGGHVTPALAIADALVRRGRPRDSIRFVGAARGLEAEAVPAAGYPIDLLVLDGIQRSLAPRAVWRSARAVASFVAAFFRALVLLRRQRPEAVVGVGGYASAPVVLAARAVRIPTVVHEQNAVPGLVNRLAVRAGAVPAVSFPTPRWPGAVLTGNPIPRAVADVVRAPVVPPLVAIVGGSLGAGRLNRLGLDLYERWRHRTDVAVHHVVGPRNLDELAGELAARRRPDDRLDYRVVGYETDMAGLYRRAAFLVCRAGATTVAEAAAVGIGAVYVPWAGSAEGQQEANAQAMVTAGGGVMVADSDCTIDRVGTIIDDLVGDPPRCRALDAAARTQRRPDAADAVAALVEDRAHGG